MDPKPGDFTTLDALEKYPRDRMIKSVMEGRPGTAMIAWGNRLGKEKIAAVVDYIIKEFMGASTPEEVEGEHLFVKNCAVCHGERGDGVSRAADGLMKRPRNFTSDRSKKELTRERMVFSVTYGVPNSPMVGFKGRLAEEQIEKVVDFIREKFMKLADKGETPEAHKSALAAIEGADMSAPFPNGLSGNQGKGGKFYKNNCAACHGWFGDGTGPRSKFISPKPRNFDHPASRKKYNRPALFKAISKGVVGTEMPAWEKVLSPQEIANVAEYVFNTFIHPSDTSGDKKKKG